MATQYTGWAAQSEASITAETNTTATITVKSYWKNEGWDYDISYITSWVYCGSKSYKVMNSGKVNSTGVGYQGKVLLGSYSFIVSKTTAAQTFSCYSVIDSDSSYAGNYTRTSASTAITVGAKPSYTITYNANGGSSTPTAQTKWYGTDITLAAAISRTGHTFSGWNTKADGTGTYHGASSVYSGNASLTLYAQWIAHSYTVSYNANGGSGAPNKQTKTHGVNLTLSSTKPTRTNYNFKGWATSSGGAVAYQPGGTYTANANVTLYAIWELAYVKPRITNITVDRCDSSGTVTDEGTYARVKFTWTCDKTVSSIKIEWKLSTTTSYSNSITVSASGTTKSENQIVGSGALDVEHTYDFRITVADASGSTSVTSTLAGLGYIIDILNSGKGIAFGKPAETDDLFEVEYQAQFNNDVFGMVFGLGQLPGIPSNSDFNNYRNPGSYAVGSDDTANTISNIPISKAGRLYIMTGTGASASSIYGTYAYLIQIYITYTANIYIRNMYTSSTAGVWTYGNWKTVVS